MQPLATPTDPGAASPASYGNTLAFLQTLLGNQQTNNQKNFESGLGLENTALANQNNQFNTTATNQNSQFNTTAQNQMAQYNAALALQKLQQEQANALAQQQQAQAAQAQAFGQSNLQYTESPAYLSLLKLLGGGSPTGGTGTGGSLPYNTGNGLAPKAANPVTNLVTLGGSTYDLNTPAGDFFYRAYQNS